MPATCAPERHPPRSSPHRPGPAVRQRRDDGDGEGDARGGAVPRSAGVGQMHTQVGRIVEAGVEAGEPVRVREHPRQRDLRFGPTRPGDAQRPAAGRLAALTTGTSPSSAVTLRPRATLDRRVRPASSSSGNRGAPRYWLTVSGFISRGGGEPSARARAGQPQNVWMRSSRRRISGSGAADRARRGGPAGCHRPGRAGGRAAAGRSRARPASPRERFWPPMHRPPGSRPRPGFSRGLKEKGRLAAETRDVLGQPEAATCRSTC